MSPARVLVVDDNRDMAEGIAMLLRDIPLEVTTAYSGRAALAHLEKHEYAVVVTDVRMPRYDGHQLLDRIRERWPRTQVVLLTAYGSIDSAVAAMKRGASDYLTKPFDNRDLIEVVSRCLMRAGGDEFDAARTLARVTAVVSPDDLFGGLTKALDILRSATSADDGELFLLEPDGKDALLSLWVGPDSDVLIERMRFGSNVGYPGIVAATGRPIAVQDGVADDRRYLRQAVVERGIRSYACVPLLEPRGSLGSVHLLSRGAAFPADRVVGLLEQAAIPITNALRAGLAALREQVDAAAAGHQPGSPAQMRAMLDRIQQAAGASHATMTVVDPSTGLPAQSVSTSPVTLMCSHAEAGAWTDCPSVSGAHGFAAERGRRTWPTTCRRGIPDRVSCPCCLPLAANGRFHGLITFDLGRCVDDRSVSRLVPLLVMAQQAAVRLAPHHGGLPRGDVRPGGMPRLQPAPDVELELRCLGPFAIVRSGKVVAPEQFPRSKALSLLKLLALHAGTPLTRDYLIEQLWPCVDPESGANRLHGVVHALRLVIEPRRGERTWTFVRNRGEVYYLDTAGPLEIDLVRFRLLLGRAQAATDARPDESISLLEQAVALYRGDLFADDPYAEWCRSERRELQEQQLDALTRLARLQAKHGDPGRAVERARAALRLAPYRATLLRAIPEVLSVRGCLAEAHAVNDELARTGRDAHHELPSPSKRRP